MKEKTTDAYIDGQKITDNVSARQSARGKMTGKPARASTGDWYVFVKISS